MVAVYSSIMKNRNLFICLLASLAIANNMQAQEKVDSAILEIPTRSRGLQLTIEGGKMNFTNTEDDYGYNGGHFYSVLGYKINQKISAGVGLGFDAVGMSYQGGIQSLKLNNTTGEIEKNTSWLSEELGVFKVFARGQYRFTDNRFSPFVACDLGLRFTSGLQNIYGENWLFDEDESWRFGSNREEYIAGSLTQLLGKPSIVNVFATPIIGLSLRTTNNSYLELKAGYTLSPYAMGVRKSTDYTFDGEQITHIASCRPIKMSAPFVSLSFTHTFRYWSDLDESLYDAIRERKREQRLQNLEKGLVIAGAVLGTAAAVAGTISAVQNNSSGVGNSTPQVGSQSKTNGSKNNASASSALNERSLIDAYNGYHGQLSDMKTWPERHNHTQRKNIQNKMREIRQELKNKYGRTISKSEFEDWDGN